MSENNNQTSLTRDNDISDVPVAAIVCGSVGGYVVLVLLFLVIRRLLVSKGIIQSDCCYLSCPSCTKCNRVLSSCYKEGCLATVCRFDKGTKCKDIFCSCCTCHKRCCNTCTNVCQPSLNCCHHPRNCCACNASCPSCFDNDLDPDACGCLCLEIKLRTAHRHSSALPTENYKNNTNSHISPHAANNHRNMYHTDKFSEITPHTNLGISHSENGRIKERPPFLSHNTPVTLSTKVYDSNTLTTTESINSVRVNFCTEKDEPLARFQTQRHLTSSTNLPGNAQRNSSNDFVSSMEKTNSLEANGRLVSRTRRHTRPGQISQRFPNKILVSSDPLNFRSLENSNSMSKVSPIPTNEKFLTNVAFQFDTVRLSRQLPPLKRTI